MRGAGGEADIPGGIDEQPCGTRGQETEGVRGDPAHYYVGGGTAAGPEFQLHGGVGIQAEQRLYLSGDEPLEMAADGRLYRGDYAFLVEFKDR